MRSQTERASCFHRTDSDLSSEVSESYASPAERALLSNCLHSGRFLSAMCVSAGHVGARGQV